MNWDLDFHKVSPPQHPSSAGFSILLLCTAFLDLCQGTRDRGGIVFFCSGLLQAKLFSLIWGERREEKGSHSRWPPFPIISRGWFSGCWLGDGKGIEPKCSNRSYLSISLSQNSCSRNCQWSVTWCHSVSPQSLRSSKYIHAPLSQDSDFTPKVLPVSSVRYPMTE